MSLSFDELSKLFVGGDKAGRFNKKTTVYSEMAVRSILINFEHELMKNLQQDNPADKKQSGVYCFGCGFTHIPGDNCPSWVDR